MSNAAAAVYAKARTRFGERITPEQFVAMASMGSVGEVADYLKSNTKFRPELSEYSSSVWHRGNLEKMLKKHSLLDVYTLCSYEKSVGRHLFEFTMRQKEIDELITFMQYLSAGEAERYMIDVSYTFNRLSELDLIKLGEIRSPGELLEFLKPTRYYKYIAELITPDGYDITEVELALDKAMYLDACSVIKEEYPSDEAEELLSLISLKTELMDLEMLFRLLRYYKDEGERLRPCLVGVPALLRSDELKALKNAEDAGEFMDLLKKTRYGRFLKSGEFKAEDMLRFGYEVLLRKSVKNIHFSRNPATVMLSYIFYLDTELLDLTHVIEGVRYGLAEDEIKKLLCIYNYERGETDG